MGGYQKECTDIIFHFTAADFIMGDRFLLPTLPEFKKASGEEDAIEHLVFAARFCKWRFRTAIFWDPLLPERFSLSDGLL